MKKITLIVFLAFAPFMLSAQQCPEPVGDGIQYFCSNATPTLANLNVTGATLTWYSDAAGTTTIPDSTPIVSGTTYYVSNTDTGCTESTLLAITVYKQNIHFTVGPASCLDFGGNAFLVDPSDTVAIGALNINGSPINTRWWPNGAGSDLYTDNTLAQNIENEPYSQVYFGNATANQAYTYTVRSASGVCPATTTDFTIYNGAYIFYHCGPTTLGDIQVDGYPTLTWYADEAKLVPLPDITPVSPGDTFYADVNDASCADVLPVYIEDVVPEPRGTSVQYVCTNSSNVLNDLNIRGSNLTWYLNGNEIPGTTAVTHGETYTVTQTIDSCESDEKEVTVYKQSVHFEVSPQSCIDLGNNVYLVDPAAQVEIKLFDKNGDPISGLWTPTGASGAPLYVKHPTTGALMTHFGAPFNTVYFQNAQPNQSYTFNVTTTAGACPAVTNPSQKITILTGAFIYKDFCYRANTTLADLGVPGDNITWYEDAGGTTVIPDTTVVEGNETYYAGFNDPDCPDILPVIVRYKVGPPLGEDDQLFCSAATWASFGITEDDDRLEDLNICGENLTWYDSTGQNVIPGNTALVDGATYYVTQKINGCESEPLMVEVTERTCACIKEDTGWEYHRRTMSFGNTHVSCQEMNVTGPVALGTTNGTAMSDYVVRVTPGVDPTLSGFGRTLNRTSPFVVCSNNAYRINNMSTGFSGGAAVSAIRKKFIAGEVLTFDFAMVLQNPNHQPVTLQPFFKVNIFDQNGNIFEERCVISDPGHCIFNSVGTGWNSIVYSDWSCLKFNTIELQGQPVTAEIIMGDCTLSGHFAYAYVDNFFVGEDTPDVCSNSSFGYLALSSTTAVSGNEHKPCSIFYKTGFAGECEPLEPVINPMFPFNICGNLSPPISAQQGGGGIKHNPLFIEIHQNGTVVGTLPSSAALPSPGGTGFCYEINESDINVPLFGYFSFHARTRYELTCGTNINYDLKADLNGFKICPVAECPIPLMQCTAPPNSGYAQFDLNDAIPEIIGTYDPAHVIVSFYTSLGDAHNQASPITTPGSFTNTSINTQRIYARLDFNWAALPPSGLPPVPDCYDIVELDLIAGIAPDVPAYPNITALDQCSNPQSADYEFDLTEVETELMANIPAADHPDYTWDYFTTQQRAQLNQSPILDPTAYVVNVPPSATTTTIRIWVRVEGPDGCFEVTSFDLIIYPEIVYTPPTDYVLCEGQGPFDFNTKVTEMTNNSTAYDVTFHGSLTDAENGASPLPMLYTNTANQETIYVRIEDQYGCFVLDQFEIEEIPDPVPGQYNNLLMCDQQGTGTAEFDLGPPAAQILDGQAGLNIAFYEFEPDAHSGTGPTLPTLYTNTTPGLQTIYGRLEVDGTDCYVIVPLVLEVINAPPITTNITDYELCDNDLDGNEDFDLTTKEPEILNTIDPNSVTVTYHLLFADADNGVNEITDPTSYNSMGNGETIYVRVEFVSDPDCYAVESFNLVIFDPIVYTPPTDYELCDDQTPDGSTQFDLSTKETEMTNDPTLDVTFHDSLADAENGDNDLPLLYTNTTNPQTIYVRIEDQNGCFVTDEFDLIVNENPVAGTVDPLEVCDSGNGTAEFDLNPPAGQIMDGQTGMTVSFYATQPLAEGGDVSNHLPMVYTTTSTTIYGRLEETASGCYTIVPVDLEVLPLPAIAQNITTYFLCDNDQDGTEEFDLTTKEPEILNTIDPNDVNITYYEDQADAHNGVDEITDPTSFNSSGQTIYVRVEFDDANACYSTTQFILQLHPQVAYNEPMPLRVCDEGAANGIAQFDLGVATAQITGNDPNIGVTYYEGQAEAHAGDPADQLPTQYTNQVPYNDFIWSRIEDLATGCYAVEQIELIVEDAPAANKPDDMAYCDEDNDGIGSFYLTDANAQITGGAPGVVVTYHLTPADAANNANALQDPFYNNVPYLQTVYVRVETPGLDCYNTTELDLVVLDTPQLETPDDLVECDYNESGTAVFDLTEVEPQLFANIANPSDYTVAYFASQQAADNGSPAIAVPSAYTSTGSIGNNQTIHVVVSDPGNGCSSQETFDLVIVGLPEVFAPTPLELCDVNNPGDETEEFDLEQATLEITGGDTSILVTYHETQADADNGTNALASPYANTENNQTIYIRIESGEGCIITQGYTLTLVVQPLPSPEAPIPLEGCDPNNDGFHEFQLEDATAQILNNEPNVVVTYHETETDAEVGIFAIDTSVPYENILQHQQTVYVRLENTVTGCHTVVELLLIVHDTPDVPVYLDDLIVCSEDQDFVAKFDLTERAADIYGAQNPNDFVLTYHLTEQDALDGTAAITQPHSYTNTAPRQQIWVRLEVDGGSACSEIGSFWIEVVLPPDIVDPTPLDICDSKGGTIGIAEFNLRDKNAEITKGQPGLEVQYYETYAGSRAGTGQIVPDTAYTNTHNLQTLYVRVYSATTGCESFTTLTLRVYPNPTVKGPPDMEACDAANPGSGFAEFDLTFHEAYMLDGATGLTVTYHLNAADAEAGTNEVRNPGAYTNTETPNQIIHVRVTNPTTGCYTVVELLLVVNPLPDAGNLDLTYTVCEPGTNGHARFDLTTIRSEILDGFGADASSYKVTFHENRGDQDVPKDAIPEPFLSDYQNTQPHNQTLFIRVEHIATGCFVTGTLLLEVLDGAVIGGPGQVLEVCEDVLGSGIGTFDLTQLDTHMMAGQSPNDFTLTYHPTQGDADNNTNTIGSPGAYQSPTATIYARVTKNSTGCYETVAVELVVVPQPVIAFEDGYRICVDEFGNVIIEEFGPTSPPTIHTGLNTNDYAFVWELDGSVLFGESGSSIVAMAPGVYTVTATHIGTGCTASESTTVAASSPPFQYSAQAVTGAFAGNHTIVATATGLGNYMFKLDDGPYQGSGTFDNVSPGTHIITISDENGCGSVTVEVGVIDYPLFFTPNDDGYHDTWNIIGIAAYPSARIYIFDRYGKLLKQISPTGPGWDGTYNGRPMPSNDYWFRVAYEEEGVEKEFKGHFTLKR